MQIKLAVFDMAGTVVNDENAVVNAFSNAFRKFGLEVPTPWINPLMGYKKTNAIGMVLTRMMEHPSDQLVNDIHEIFVSDMEEYYASSPGVSVMPDAEEVMEALQQSGVAVTLNTGFPKSIADVIVRRFEWLEHGLVDHYVASDEVKYGRPDPAMINRLMNLTNVTDPLQVLKVGDTEVDIREGRNAGCGMVIAVTTGAFTREELEPFNPDYIVNNLSEILSIVGSFAGKSNSLA